MPALAPKLELGFYLFRFVVTLRVSLHMRLDHRADRPLVAQLEPTVY